ncbi:MAG: hypothetical protein JWN76_2006 [Chitinophagaceae bacterium]|nr:hypothetical protein [Chitinophagaceae bacterium]
MKLLFVGPALLGDYSTGPGYILNNTLNTLPDHITAEVMVFRNNTVDKSEKATFFKGNIKQVVFESQLAPLTSFNILRATFTSKLVVEEQLFLHKIEEITPNFQYVIWLGSPYDPISTYLPKYSRVPVLFHISDSIFLFEQRRKKIFNTRILIAKLREKQVLKTKYHKFIYVSHEDYLLAKGLAPAEMKMRVVLLPIGIDIHMYFPVERQKRNRFVLLFSGNLSYKPNEDASKFIISQILPQIPVDFEVRIAGRNPTQAIIEAKKRYPNLVVTGEVDDMKTEYDNADLYLAPMVSAAGIKIKILEAMACGLPVLASKIAADAFAVTPHGIVRCTSVSDFIANIFHYASNHEDRMKLGGLAASFIKADWAWQVRTNKFISYLK